MSSRMDQSQALTPDEKRELLARLLKEKAEKSKSYHPLSHNQRAMWFLYQLAPESAAYHAGFASRILSPVDAEALRRAFETLVARHAILRTTYGYRDGELCQVVHGRRDTNFAQVDAREWSEDRVNEEVLVAYTEPFDLEQGNVLRVRLFTRAHDEHVLLITIHHIAYDGWSHWILLDELRSLYKHEVTGEASGLPKPDVQYADYVRWQEETLAGEAGEKMWRYWQNELSGELPVLNLPTDRPRPVVQTYAGATHLFEIEEGLTQALKELAREEGATLYMVLLAAFHVLLHRYTGQKDIVVGSPMSGRSRPEFAGVVGDFINMVSLRADLSGDPTFKAFLEQVRQTVLGALANQDYPFSLLVERLASKRDSSRSPIFQVSLNALQPHRFKEIVELFVAHDSNESVDFGGLELKPFLLTQQEGQLDLSLEMTEVGGALSSVLKYNTDLFDEATIVRMQRHYLTLLSGIVSNPEQRVSRLPLLPKAEMEELLYTWNNTVEAYPRERQLHELFETQVERTPTAIAAVYEGKGLSYQELDERANQVARHLRALGAGPEIPVAICVERSLEMLVGLLGILKAGSAYVPLDPGFPAERLSFMLADSEAPILLTEMALADELRAGVAHVVDIDADWAEIAERSTTRPSRVGSPEDLAYIIYTSGSTGKPKGVQIPHRAVVNFLHAMAKEPGLAAEDVLLAVTTLSFDISVLELFLPLIVGGQVVIASSEVASDGRLLGEALAASGATVMQATPATWRMMIAAGWSGNEGLKVLCGGEALPRELAEQLIARSDELWNMYGPTETTVWSAVKKLAAEALEAGEPISIGRPIANTEIYVLDKQLQPVPVGVPGGLYIGGAGLAKGYLNRPALTAEKFIAHPFREEVGARLYDTGDVARTLADGRLEHLGRSDHQVKVRGFRIELGEIETVLVRHEAVHEAVVIVRAEEGGEQRLVAYLIVEEGVAEPSVGELRDFVQQSLPDYMVPSAYVFLESYPLTPNKKVDRKALPAPAYGLANSGRQFIAPRNEVEEKVAAITADVLNIPEVGVMDDFFELGGHSLLATTVLTRVAETFSINIPLRNFFKTPTVANLAEQIEIARWLGEEPAAVPEANGEREEFEL